jgi:spore germination protein YaaH
MGASAAGVALVWEEADALRQEQGAALQWWEADDLGLVQEPWFSYAEGARHVTFANADSVEARAQLARDAGLRGVILWRLGGEDPGLWDRLPRRIHRTWLPTLSTTP